MYLLIAYTRLRYTYYMHAYICMYMHAYICMYVVNVHDDLLSYSNRLILLAADTHDMDTHT